MKVQHILGAAPLYTNTFLLVTDQKHGILIDAAAEPDTYKKALAEQGATLTHILLTHGHYDHVGAVAALRRETGCKVYLDPADALGDALYPLKASDVEAHRPACFSNCPIPKGAPESETEGISSGMPPRERATKSSSAASATAFEWKRVTISLPSSTLTSRGLRPLATSSFRRAIS